MPETTAGKTFCLATLLAATREGKPPFEIQEPEPGKVRLKGNHPGKLELTDGDLSVRTEGGGITVRFAETPAVPDDLQDLQAR